MPDVDVLITSLLFACRFTAITSVPLSFSLSIPNEEHGNVRLLERRERITSGLSHVNITQQPSNQAKKWHNEDGSLWSSERRCVYAGWRMCECKYMLVCFNEKQISIVCTLNNKDNQSPGSCLIKR